MHRNRKESSESPKPSWPPTSRGVEVSPLLVHPSELLRSYSAEVGSYGLQIRVPLGGLVKGFGGFSFWDLRAWGASGVGVVGVRGFRALGL